MRFVISTSSLEWLQAMAPSTQVILALGAVIALIGILFSEKCYRRFRSLLHMILGTKPPRRRRKG